MTDRHLNLFYTYGNSARWEDNFTRAFLLTLKSLAPVHFRLFLRDMLLDEEHQHLRDRIDLRAEDDRLFDLQVSEATREGDPKLTSENGVLVTIDTTGAEELTLEKGSSDGGARVDALVSDAEADVTAVIEVKLGSHQSPDQLARHHTTFFDSAESDPNDVHVAVSWEQVIEYLDSLRRQSVGDREGYILDEFVDYADELGLAPFRGFQEQDFARTRRRTLRKLLQLLMARHGAKLGGSVGSSPAHRLDFDDISENAWIEYDYVDPPVASLRVAIVAGADGIWHARQFKKALQHAPDEFRKGGNVLADEVRGQRPDVEVVWRPKTRYFASRGQDKAPGVARFFAHPENFNGFVSRMLDDRANPCDWIPRHEVETRLADELRGRDLSTGDDGRFPPWEDKNEVLVSSFFHLELLVPRENLVGKGRDATVELLVNLLQPLRTSAVRLNELKNQSR